MIKIKDESFLSFIPPHFSKDEELYSRDTYQHHTVIFPFHCITFFPVFLLPLIDLEQSQCHDNFPPCVLPSRYIRMR